jgi:cyclopropane-fatty-acyl-phospholipid synthase
MDRRFDRIVSVGMFEHVGVVNYRAFFDALFRCLELDGDAVALLHSIGQWDGRRTKILGFANASSPARIALR